MDNIFPISSEPIQNIFRICGKCSRCKKNSSVMINNFKNTEINVKEPNNLFTDEYILICSSDRYLPKFSQNSSPNPSTIYISNYGGFFTISDYGIGCRGEIQRFIDNCGGEIECLPLTQEFINYYNSINFYGGEWNHIFRLEDSRNMILEYHKYSKEDKNEQYKLEKTKLEIQKMSKELQENEIAYIKIKEEVDNKIQFIANEEKKLKDEKILHKEKVKNLMDRENKIYQKEKLKDIHQDLKDITVSLYNYLDVLDLPNNQFETRISQIITSLNKFYQEDTVVVAENVNSNVIIAEPSAPLFL